MKVLVQWARTRPQGWCVYDSADWQQIIKKTLPVGDDIIDDSEGWVHRLNVQGISFSADHYAVIHHADHVEVITWNDDTEDWLPHEFMADHWHLHDRLVDVTIENVRHQGPLQHRILYLTSELETAWQQEGLLPMFSSGGQVDVRPWSQFSPPDESLVLHGIWLPEDLNFELQKYASPSWKEWFRDG